MRQLKCVGCKKHKLFLISIAEDVLILLCDCCGLIHEVDLPIKFDTLNVPVTKVSERTYHR